MRSLTSQHLKEFYKYERNGGQNGKPKKGTTVVRYHSAIHKALEVALENKQVLTNAAHKQRPNSDKFIGNFYMNDEAMKLISIAEGTKLELPILFGLLYGLRRSEIVGLKWQNFDFFNDSFTIASTVVEYRKDGKTITHKKNKTKNQSSMRSLPLLPIFKEKLLTLRKKQENDRELFGDYYLTENQSYVLVNEIGELIKPNYISSTFPKLLKKHGMRHIRFHDTRHSCASLLLKHGVSMKEIQAYLGHSDFTTTANLYAHLEVDEAKYSAANKLAGMLMNPNTAIDTLNAQSQQFAS